LANRGVERALPGVGSRGAPWGERRARGDEPGRGIRRLPAVAPRPAVVLGRTALGLGVGTIAGHTYGGDLASTWSIHPDELQAEVAGWPRKSTGTTQVRRTISHSLPRET